MREIFGTLQGEGGQSGSPATFLRFAGCNLGYEVCPWCDTDWVKARFKLPVADLVERIRVCAVETFGEMRDGLLLVATGGEPSLQFDQPLSDALREIGFRIAMESNGSRKVDLGLVDWLTISPKQAEFEQKEGNELKVVFSGNAGPGPAPDVESVLRLAEGTTFDHYFLQAVDLPGVGPNYEETVEAVMRLGPPWRLSVQAHKVLGLP